MGAGKPASLQHPALPHGPGTVTATITLTLPSPGPWPVACDPGSAQPSEGRRPLRSRSILEHSSQGPRRCGPTQGAPEVGRKGAVCASFSLSCSVLGVLEGFVLGPASLGTGYPQGRVSSWRWSCSCSCWQGSPRGSQTPPKPQQGPHKNWALQLLQLGVLLWLRPPPALHPRAEGHTSKGGAGLLGAPLAVPQLGSPSVRLRQLFWHLDPPHSRGIHPPGQWRLTQDPQLTGPQRQPEPVVPGRPGRPTLTLCPAVQGGRDPGRRLCLTWASTPRAKRSAVSMGRRMG